MIRPIAILSAVLAASSAYASDGIINFTGEIVAASCSMTGGSGTGITGDKGKQSINVELGKVPVDTIGVSSGSTGITAGKNININLDCGNTGTGLSTVKVSFDPAGGTGFDSKNNALLAVDGGASGVGIGLYDSKNKLINLRASEFYEAPLVKDGEKYSADLNIRAAYVANGAEIKPGAANASLPFTLTYE